MSVLNFDNDCEAFSDLRMGRQPLSPEKQAHASVSTHSLTPYYTKELVGQINDDLWKWGDKLQGLEEQINEYFDWLLYTRIQFCTKEGEKVIDVKSNEIVVPWIFSQTLERIGVTVSDKSSVIITPVYGDGDIFKRYGKSKEEARMFILSTARKLRPMLQEIGVVYATGISSDPRGDYETMRLHVQPEDNVDDDRVIGDGNEHPICAFFAAMLGLQMKPSPLYQGTVEYERFSTMRILLLKAVSCGRKKSGAISGQPSAKHAKPGKSTGDRKPATTPETA